MERDRERGRERQQGGFLYRREVSQTDRERERERERGTERERERESERAHFFSEGGLARGEEERPIVMLVRFHHGGFRWEAELSDLHLERGRREGSVRVGAVRAVDGLREGNELHFKPPWQFPVTAAGRRVMFRWVRDQPLRRWSNFFKRETELGSQATVCEVGHPHLKLHDKKPAPLKAKDRDKKPAPVKLAKDSDKTPAPVKRIQRDHKPMKRSRPQDENEKPSNEPWWLRGPTDAFPVPLRRRGPSDAGPSDAWPGLLLGRVRHVPDL